MARKATKVEAILLREKGHSYREIWELLGVPKGTCSDWLRDVAMSAKAKARIHQLGIDGRRHGREAIQLRTEKRDREISSVVDTGMKKIKLTPEIGKLLCSMLYWGEGTKNLSTVNFMNSDPDMIAVYLKLLRTYFVVKPEKFRAQLHLHSYHNTKKQKQFWAEVTGISEDRISIYKKENSGKNIKIGYPGCISIRYYDSRLAREINYYYNALIDKLGVSVNGKPQLSKS